MKLIAIDMDGTLLSHDLQISEHNMNAIQQAQREGHIVMICSGRAKEDLSGLLQRYNLSLPLGTSNGAVVYVNDTLLQASYINKAIALQTALHLEAEGFPYKVYTNQGIYVPTNWNENVMHTWQAASSQSHNFTIEDVQKVTEQQLQSNVIRSFDNISALLSSDELEVEKFFILTLDDQVRTQLLEHLQVIDEIGITASAPTNLEAMNRNAHKGNGLRAMAKHFGIPMEHTVAIGDNFNDVPMMQAAGFSIAMGNAEQEVKDLCDAVTLTNEEHGVAHALETYVLQKTKQL